MSTFYLIETVHRPQFACRAFEARAWAVDDDGLMVAVGVTMASSEHQAVESLFEGHPALSQHPTGYRCPISHPNALKLTDGYGSHQIVVVDWRAIPDNAPAWVLCRDMRIRAEIAAAAEAEEEADDEWNPPNSWDMPSWRDRGPRVYARSHFANAAAGG